MIENYEQIILVGVNTNNPRFSYSMQEAANLAQACELEVIAEVTQNLERVHSKHYLGEGKLQEVKALVEQHDINIVLFNTELSPSQLRNIEQILECQIMDRTMLILKIFALRATTKEAQLQVEIAQLQYFLPRLVGLRSSMDRQGGGGQNKGLGEKKIELDRRRIEQQITYLKKDLELAVSERQTQRKWRKKQGIKTIALVGYTNAGKSTLMNTILHKYHQETDKEVFTKDMLFATLQTASRRIDCADKTSFILTDTVGFVSELPHHLVEAFKSTLEEISEADVLIHVLDASDEYVDDMRVTTEETLQDLHATTIPTIYAYNKMDKISTKKPITSNACYISAKNDIGVTELLEQAFAILFADLHEYQLLIPYDRGDIVAFYHQHAKVLTEQFLAEGTLLTLQSEQKWIDQYQDDLLKIVNNQSE